MNKLRKICIRRGGALGDVIMLTPVVRELFRRHDGNVHIYVATKYPLVFANSPWVAACIPPETIDPEFFDEIFDLDLVYERSPESHVIDAYSQAVFGTCIEQKGLELFSSSQHAETARYLLRQLDGKPYIVVHISNTSWPNRNLPKDFWLAVLSQLLKIHDGYIVQIGIDSDGFIEGHPRLVNLVGKSELHVTKELISGARAFLGIDTATLHIAASTMTPIACMFTCVNHEFRKPFREGPAFVPIAANIECYGCQARYTPPATTYQCSRGDVACVRRFDPAAIAQQVSQLASPGLSTNQLA